VRDARSRFPGLEVEVAVETDTLEGGRQAARVLLTKFPRLTALVCVNDVMAVGALREVRSRGCRVPEDVSVSGFDNVTLAQFSVPALTTVHIPREQIGRTICECLIRDDVVRDREYVIEPELVVRDSTGPAPR
jgi:LacI family transcriptional regulator